MDTIERSNSHLVLGGWKPVGVIAAAAMLAAPVGMYFLTAWEEAWMMWANLLVAVVAIRIALLMTLWARIEFDVASGEVRFEQLTPVGRNRRAAALKPVSRIEIETTRQISRAGARPARRLALVTGHERTPFTRLFTSSRQFESERDFLNGWLKEAFGDRWRDAATGLGETERSRTDADIPAGATRIWHPRTGLTIDTPKDWSASVSLDRSGPLRIFGVTLLPRLHRAGPRRSPEDSNDWNNLVAVGAEDAGLQLAIHDGPLDRSLEGTLDDPWSKQWGTEVVESTPEIEIGGMKGFSITRRMPEGGTTSTFGKVSEAVTTRQVWLGSADMHVEAVGMARVAHPDVRQALDAMIESVRLPRAS